MVKLELLLVLEWLKLGESFILDLKMDLLLSGMVEMQQRHKRL